MNRIVLIGCGGSGKSTLSRKLSKKLNLPLYHLDKIFWNEGWIETPKDEFDKEIKDIINTDKWIVDGNYIRTLEMRIKKADTVIFLNMPTHLCVYRIIKRRFMYRNISRPDMARGCVEGIDWEFFSWVLGYNKNIRPAILATLNKYKDKNIVILSSTKEVQEFIDNL